MLTKLEDNSERESARFHSWLKYMRNVLVGLLLVFLVGLAGSQTIPERPNLSGTWKLVKFPENSAYKGSILLIDHRDPEVRISRKITVKGQEKISDFVYFTDGRGETNVGPITGLLFEGVTISSVTSWNKKRLTTTYTVPVHISGSGQSKDTKHEVVDEWELSKDGNKLTQTRYTKDSSGMPGYPIFNNLPPVRYEYARQP